MDPLGIGGSDVTMLDNPREEMSCEIEARLSARRGFYRRSFVVFAVIVLGTSLSAIWLSPHEWGYILAASASAILGTAAILFLAYEVRKSALYEQAGRSLLRDR
jgi:hypothetical protein